jgi:hypothetical protein
LFSIDFKEDDDDITDDTENNNDDKQKSRLDTLKRSETIKRESIQVVDAELKDVDKSVQLQQEQQKVMMNVEITSTTTTTTAKEDNNETQSQETVEMLINEQKELKSRVSELELEIDTMSKKNSSLEASLARWIFRACDYKAEIDEDSKNLRQQHDIEMRQLKENHEIELKKVKNIY